MAITLDRTTDDTLQEGLSRNVHRVKAVYKRANLSGRKDNNNYLLEHSRQEKAILAFTYIIYSFESSPENMAILFYKIF